MQMTETSYRLATIIINTVLTCSLQIIIITVIVLEAVVHWVLASSGTIKVPSHSTEMRRDTVIIAQTYRYI